MPCLWTSSDEAPETSFNALHSQLRLRACAYANPPTPAQLRQRRVPGGVNFLPRCILEGWRRERYTRTRLRAVRPVEAALRLTALVGPETRAIRTLHAGKDLQRDQFDI